MATTDVSVKLDNDLKERAQYIFETLGLDISTAINMLLRKLVYQQETPLSEPVKKTRVRPPFEYDCMYEKMWIADDFDAPLDDFKEYME